MSSEDVATYICELGAVQRRMDYARQILAQNPSFTPTFIFNHNSTVHKTSLNKQEFIDVLKSLELACNQYQLELIFGYFQTEGKTYINLDDFSQGMLPQSDETVKKIALKRSVEHKDIDYSLKYALHKLFFQIIQGQVKLESLCRFAFQLKERIKPKRLEIDSLTQFLAYHYKYPNPSTSQLILKSLARGQLKRHQHIVDYILEFNDQNKIGGSLPKVISREPATFAQPRSEFILTANKQNSKNTSNIVKPISKLELSYNTLINPLLSQQVLLESVGPKTNPRPRYNPLQGVNEVQEKIKQLMSKINLQTASIIRQQSKQIKATPQSKFDLSISSIPSLTARQIKEESSKDKTQRRNNKQLFKKNTYSSAKDQQSSPKKAVNASSELIINPKGRSITGKNPVEKTGHENNKEDESKRRVQYLKRLVSEKNQPVKV